MIKKWLSAYNPRYPRSLVYMLQACGYNVSAYLNWLGRIKSFHRVEVRKSLVMTIKARVLLALAWIIILVTILIAFDYLFYESAPWNLIIFFSLVIFSPYILALGVLLPLFIIKFFIQLPFERKMISDAKGKLAKHKAIKIGIAGSFGKTTMREILKTVIAEGKRVAAPSENHNTLFGICNFIKNLKGDEEVLIFELGEYYKGDIQEMCELVNPSIGIITGINEAHLERFKNLETTISTIFELSDWLKDDHVYVNGENKLAKENAKKEHMLYSKKGIREWQVENARTDLSGTSFFLSIENKKFEFKSGLLGLHQVGPLALSVRIAYDMGISIENIQRGVSNTKPFIHRLCPKTDENGVTILDDSYNGNPDGARAVIEFLRSIKGRRRFYVTPGLVEIGNKSESVHKEIGRNLAKAGIAKVILIRNSVTPFIEQGLKESGYTGDVLWFENGPEAYSALPHLAVNGDIILLQNDWPDQYF